MSNSTSVADSGLPRSGVRRWLGPLANGTSDALPILIRLAIGFASVYAASIAYGFLAGYALPTIAIFSAIPHADLVLRAEKYLPFLTFVTAFAGAALAWLAKWHFADEARVQRNEMTCMRLVRRWGFVLVPMALVMALSEGGWVERSVADVSNYFSIASLVPHSDAGNYFYGAVEQVQTGEWDSVPSQRPFAAAFRQLTMGLAGYSYVGTLLLQTGFIAVALLAAARSIALWRGVWAGIAFCTFIYILLRPFLATVMTEPLSVAWGLLSIMFLVDALRFQQRQYAYLALVCFTFAEITRMGSVFTVPALVLWIALAFAPSLPSRLKVLGIASALVGLVLLTQQLCASLYTSPNVVTGGNFAYVLCGLAAGQDWTACPQMFAQEFGRLTTQRDQAAFLYSKAVELIFHNPEIALGAISQNAANFIQRLPTVMMFGYPGVTHGLQEWGLLALIPGLYAILTFKRAPYELALWVFILISLIISAAIIFADDGARTMYATWPLVALFLSFGFVSPASASTTAYNGAAVSARLGILLISTVAILIVVFPALNRLWPGAEWNRLSKLNALHDDTQRLLVGPAVTGFIVVADDAPLPNDLPALHASSFVRLVTKVEEDFGPFADAALEKIPFAFIAAVRSDIAGAQAEQLYVAPIGILKDLSATAWRVRIDDRLHNDHVREITEIQRLP